MAKIYIGTSGYSYKDWIGPFYPEKTQEKDFLVFYAARFPFVELNFSYYSMPSAALLSRLIEKTPPEFIFSIKGHKSITHEIGENIVKDLETFKKGIAPLAEKNKLAAILVQFPYSFHYAAENRSHLDRVTRLLCDFPLAIEFRNAEWVKDSVIAGLAERHVTFVNVDQPDLPRLIRPSAFVTSDPAYIRFHGRNKAAWWKGDNVTRYDYLYSDDELAGWIEQVRAVIEKARVLLITFNNHARAQAVVNAGKLKELLLSSGIGQVV